MLRIFRSTFPSDSRIDKTMPWTSFGDSCTDGDPQGPLEFGEARSRRAGIPAGGSVQPPSDHGQTRPQTEPSSVIDLGADRQVVADSCGQPPCGQMGPNPWFESMDSSQVLSSLVGDRTHRSVGIAGFQQDEATRKRTTTGSSVPDSSSFRPLPDLQVALAVRNSW